MSRLFEAARRLSVGRLQHERLQPLPKEFRPADEHEAYLVQRELHALLGRGRLGEIVGHKIGCTTPVMQRFLNISHPCAGAVFSTTVHRGSAQLRHADFLRPGVECEIAVELSADLGPERAPFTKDNVEVCIGGVMCAMEIVDDRYEDYKAFDVPTLIADDFFDAGCVLGKPLADWRAFDLAAQTGTTRINGVEVGRGKGADIMGHPFASLAWLANSMLARGQYLKRGEFVLLGSVVETKWVNAGDEVVVEIERLGEVSARFA